MGTWIWLFFKPCSKVGIWFSDAQYLTGLTVGVQHSIKYEDGEGLVPNQLLASIMLPLRKGSNWTVVSNVQNQHRYSCFSIQREIDSHT